MKGMNALNPSADQATASGLYTVGLTVTASDGGVGSSSVLFLASGGGPAAHSARATLVKVHYLE